ncbi:hypothetical protein [Streptomyces sp. NPDC004658]|uniref:hypothetical protein n=1 Tax=Streptomyces sp. NPDC004658 TaxID=3154672 RepID=UPI0033AE3A9B
MPRMVRALTAWQGTPPRAIVLEPEPAGAAGLVKDFGRAVEQFSSVLSEEELTGYLRSADRLRAQEDGLSGLGRGLLELFREAAGRSFRRAGVPEASIGELTEDLVSRFAAFVAYTLAAHRADPEPDFSSAVVIRSAGPARHPTPGARELSFDVERSEIARDPRVARAVSELLADGGQR